MTYSIKKAGLSKVTVAALVMAVAVALIALPAANANAAAAKFSKGNIVVKFDAALAAQLKAKYGVSFDALAPSTQSGVNVTIPVNKGTKLDPKTFAGTILTKGGLNLSAAQLPAPVALDKPVVVLKKGGKGSLNVDPVGGIADISFPKSAAKAKTKGKKTSQITIKGASLKLSAAAAALLSSFQITVPAGTELAKLDITLKA